MKIQFEIPEVKVYELEQLMKIAGASSKKELFNDALTLLEWAIDEAQKDRIIGSISKDGDSYRELQMRAFSNAKSYAHQQNANINKNRSQAA